MLPLDDIRVIEVDNWMAAPAAMAVLADLGADVIKVEPLHGDAMRGAQRPPKLPEGQRQAFDYGFNVDNRGKRSIAVDLTTDAGAALVARLCASADVFACNLLPNRQARFGLDAESLHGVNPRLVHATFTGYGTTGPDAERPGFDVTAFFARSGLSDATKEGPDGVVPRPGVAQGDHSSAMSLVGAILAGLRMAERTGEGQIVEASLFGTAVWTLANDLAVTVEDRAPVRSRSRHTVISPVMNRFPTGDGKWLMLNLPARNGWDVFCRAVGKDDWLERKEWSSGKLRYKAMTEIIDEMDALFATKGRDEWGEIFDAGGVVWGPVLSLDEVVDDPQAEAAGLFPTMTHPEFGEFRTVAAPFMIHDVPMGPRRIAPEIGENTVAVLTEAGLNAEEIDALHADGIIGKGGDV